MEGFARFPAYSPDPDHPHRLAFSSRQPGATSVIGEDHFEHIWVLDGVEGAERVFYRITDDNFNDFDPAWSPEGRHLAFTREMDGRFDIWTVDVGDLFSLENPGAPVRLTSESVVPSEASEASWLEMDGELYIVFASDGDIFRIHRSGGSAFKHVPDPLDVVSACDLDEYPDFQPAVALGGAVAFTSVGREQVGSLQVKGYTLGDTPTDTTWVTGADIYLDGCRTGYTTPYTFHYLPVKPFQLPYAISLQVPTQCDVPQGNRVLLANQQVTSNLRFTVDRGWVYLWVEYGNCNIYVDGAYVLRLNATGAIDSVLSCIPEGDREIRVEWNAETWVDTVFTVTAGRTDSLFVYLPKGTSRRNLMSPASAGRSAMPPQVGYEQMWVADLEEHAMVGFWSTSSEFEQPAWSRDGEYVAFVSSDVVRNRWGIRVVQPWTSSSVWSIPLPGSGGSAVCVRSAYHVSWNSADVTSQDCRIAVSMGSCRGNEGSQELQIWVIDPRPFLGQ